ncbi:MAG TPA: helix-turn-helix transcriptional regulator [Ktedonobacteraceae bacterium]
MPSDQSNQNIGQSVGANLRTARLAKKYTQGRLAHPDFSVSYISAIERGQIHPSLRALEILATRLGLSSTDLLPHASSNNSNTGSTLTTSSQGALDIEVQLLEAQLAIRQGAAEQAIIRLRELALENLTARQRLQIYYLLGQAYSITSQFQEGEYALAEATKLIKDPNDELSLQILNLLGVVYTSMHNYAQAFQIHQRCLDMFENMQPQNPFLMARVYTNMGLHYTYLNKFQQAVEMFQKALTLTAALESAEELQSIYWHLFEHYRESKNYEQADLYGHQLFQVSSQEYSQSLRSELYHNLGRAMLKMDQQTSYAYLEKTLVEVATLEDQLAQSVVTTQYAQWLLAHDRIPEALEQAEKALALLSSYNDSIIKAEALTTLGAIAFAQESYEAGDGHFMAALNMLDQLGALEELAAGAAAYAERLEERGKANEALFYMKKAYEARRKMRMDRQG